MKKSSIQVGDISLVMRAAGSDYSSAHSSIYDAIFGYICIYNPLPKRYREGESYYYLAAVLRIYIVSAVWLKLHVFGDIEYRKLFSQKTWDRVDWSIYTYRSSIPKPTPSFESGVKNGCFFKTWSSRSRYQICTFPPSHFIVIRIFLISSSIVPFPISKYPESHHSIVFLANHNPNPDLPNSRLME